MKALMVHIALLIVALTAQAESKGTYEFKPQDCQTYLDRKLPPNEAQDARAEHVVGWITANHPILRALFTGDLPLWIKFDLFFLTSGYLLPPEKPVILVPRQALEHYSRSITFDNIELMIDSNARGRRELRQSMSEVLDRDLSKLSPFYLRFLAELIGRSLFALDVLTDSKNHVGLSYDAERAISFKTPKKDYWISSWRSSLSIEWPATISTNHLRQLLSIRRMVDDEDVRARVVKLVDRNLIGIIKAQQERCRRLQDCSTSEEFSKILGQDVEAPQLEFRGPMNALTEPEDEPGPAGPARPFSGDSLFAFLDDDPSYTVAKLDEANLDEIWTDMQTATEVATQSLFELEGWWTDRADWPRLSRGLEPTIRSVDELRMRLGERRASLREAEESFSRADAVFRRLNAWIERTNDFVRNLELDEESISKLPRNKRETLVAILANGPLLLALSSDAVEAMVRRRSLMLDQLGAIQNVNVLLGLVALGRVTRPGPSENLSGDEEFIRLREAIRQLAGETATSS